jgi:hypothetical protein
MNVKREYVITASPRDLAVDLPVQLAADDAT